MYKCSLCETETDDVAFSVSIHTEDTRVDHIAYNCKCGEEQGQVDMKTAQQTGPWGGMVDKVAEAQRVGAQLVEEGSYYKPGAFGFSWYGGEVQAIITFTGKEPEVKKRKVSAQVAHCPVLGCSYQLSGGIRASKLAGQCQGVHSVAHLLSAQRVWR